MRKMIDIECSGCRERRLDQYVDVARLPVHTCGGNWGRVILSGTRTGAVIGDDIPGGLVIKHLDAKPKTYYTRSEIRRAAAEKGWTWGHDANLHIENPKTGSRDSADTRRWI